MTGFNGNTFDPSKIEMTPVDELPTEATPPKKTEKKKSKPTYSKSRYSRLPPVKVLNRGITDTINGTVLKDKKVKLDKDECEVGEAVMYMVEYYTAIDINHPALVMMSAVMGITFTTMQLMQQDDPERVKTKTKDSRTDIDEVAK